jgi:hypothetical protein
VKQSKRIRLRFDPPRRSGLAKIKVEVVRALPDLRNA